MTASVASQWLYFDEHASACLFKNALASSFGLVFYYANFIHNPPNPALYELPALTKHIIRLTSNVINASRNINLCSTFFMQVQHARVSF